MSPESTYSTPAIRTLGVQDRNCYFKDEVKLNVMQSYTYTNCMTECRSNLLYKLCDCVPYNYPNNGKICHQQLLHNFFQYFFRFFSHM